MKDLHIPQINELQFIDQFQELGLPDLIQNLDSPWDKSLFPQRRFFLVKVVAIDPPPLAAILHPKRRGTHD
jgi:hypothetical protein